MRWWRWIVVGLGALVVVTAVPTVWARFVALPYLRSADTVPAEQVALVFGALVDGDRPSEFLANRLDTAVDLYDRNVVTRVLVSGNNDRHGYDEPDTMRNYLVAHGIPASAITVDPAGYDTLDTCVRARRVYHVDRAILVTQAFHVARAIALCRANGVTGYGVGIPSWPVGAGSTMWGYLREYFATDKALWDVVF